MRNKLISLRQSLLFAAASAALLLGVHRLAAQSAGRDAQRLLADQLVDDARQAAHNTQIPTTLAAREAMALLNQAYALAPNSPTILRLRAEAAAALNKTTTLRQSLLQLVKIRPHDISAQVQFLDALAQSAQTVRGKINIYLAALKQPDLDAQVASAMALRVGRLLEAQSRHQLALKMFEEAVTLNSANLAALQEVAAILQQRHAASAKQVAACIAVLHADPYQPAALAAVGNILASANDYHHAAAWLNSAINQYQQVGAPVPPELMVQLAQDWAIAGDEPEFDAFMRELIAGKHPATALLMLDLTARSEGLPINGPRSNAIFQQIRKRLVAALAKNPKNAELFADLLWLDLYYAPTIPPSASQRVTELGHMLPKNSPTYLRLRGWLLLRQHFAQAARKRFVAAGNDPYAQLGLARLAVMENRNQHAAKILQALWNTHPQGLVALAVANAASNLGVGLAQSAGDAQVSAAAAVYSKAMLGAVEHPANVVLVTVSWPNQYVSYGQPLYLKVHYFNATNHTLAVGPDTAITTNVAFVGAIQGLNTVNLGAYAVDSDVTTLKLDPQNTLTVRYRVDQGPLRGMLLANPASLVGGNIQLITNPLAVGNQMKTGLGGQVVSAGYFNVRGLFDDADTGMATAAAGLATLPQSQQMLTAGALITELPGVRRAAAAAATQPAPQGSTRPDLSALSRKITTGLAGLLQPGGDPLVQAWLLRRAPLQGLSTSLADPLASLGHSPVALVRIFSYDRMVQQALATGSRSQETATAKKLLALSKAEKSAQAAQWAGWLAENLNFAAAANRPPSTAAATAPPSAAQ
ncbi:MAG: hypothetical protein HKL96_01715 [Phycisphaerales bacterium]|nr:hypothetical protein [Phycisphaerales bacterium]